MLLLHPQMAALFFVLETTPSPACSSTRNGRAYFGKRSALVIHDHQTALLAPKIFWRNFIEERAELTELLLVVLPFVSLERRVVIQFDSRNVKHFGC